MYVIVGGDAERAHTSNVPAAEPTSIDREGGTASEPTATTGSSARVPAASDQGKDESAVVCERRPSDGRAGQLLAACDRRRP